MVRGFYFVFIILFSFVGEIVRAQEIRVRVDVEGQGDGWGQNVWGEIHKEPIKKCFKKRRLRIEA